MNIFDAGGLVAFIAIVASLVLGTGIYMGLRKMFHIVYHGFGAVIGMWFGCFLAAAFIINLAAGLIVGVVSVVWFLIKLGIVLALIGSAGMFIYKKVAGSKA